MHSGWLPLTRRVRRAVERRPLAVDRRTDRHRRALDGNLRSFQHLGRQVGALECQTLLQARWQTVAIHRDPEIHVGTQPDTNPLTLRERREARHVRMGDDVEQCAVRQAGHDGASSVRVEHFDATQRQAPGVRLVMCSS